MSYSYVCGQFHFTSLVLVGPVASWEVGAEEGDLLRIYERIIFSHKFWLSENCRKTLYSVNFRTKCNTWAENP